MTHGVGRHALEVWAPAGVPEVTEGADLAALLLAALGEPLEDGDVVLVTSKVVSKAEGRVREGDRESALPAETLRVVARRGPTTIVRNHLGLTMAAAGIDASNVAAGRVVLLPIDPDASAARLRRDLHERTGRTVAVVVTDTAGRAWRTGQTDIAIGASGLVVSEAFAGRVDGHGNPLAVTEPAFADELAGAAELAQGKLTGRPFAVVRGRADLVLPIGEDGSGARALVREEGADLFAYGAREAVVHALRGDPEDQPPFGAPGGAPELVEALTRVLRSSAHIRSGAAPDEVEVGGLLPRQAVVARVVTYAHGWVVAAEEPDA